MSKVDVKSTHHRTVSSLAFDAPGKRWLFRNKRRLIMLGAEVGCEVAAGRLGLSC